ncbi:hypothetical protein [Nonomuraea sp. 3N208]|uniref:hypothetical protein n=1 Tax=Nonomuraea sp. 3N208 TaxID=3457421 RepID=UPI003FD3DD56
MMRDRPARRRLEAMLERGCATVTTFIPAAALGCEAEILFWLSVEPSMQDSVAEGLAGVQVLAVKRGFLMVPWAEDRVAAALA